jgi:hypothetical protein
MPHASFAGNLASDNQSVALFAGKIKVKATISEQKLARRVSLNIGRIPYREGGRIDRRTANKPTGNFFRAEALRRRGYFFVIFVGKTVEVIDTPRAQRAGNERVKS